MATSCSVPPPGEHLEGDPPPPGAAPSMPPSEQVWCSECGAAFATVAKLKYHRMRSHGSWREPRTCPRAGCGRSYATETNLRRHLRRAHGAGGALGGAKVCEVCGFVSGDNYHLAVHMRKHSGEKGPRGRKPRGSKVMIFCSLPPL